MVRAALLGAACVLAGCASEPATGGVSRHVLVPPADAAFVPFRCGGGVATDPVGDAAGAGQHRDAVGSAGRPAALRASDDSFLYLRLRLDGDPREAAGDLRPFGWGFLIDGDGDDTTYELLGMLEGTGGDGAALWANTSPVAELASDPAEAILVDYTPPIDYWHVEEASGAGMGGNPDWFITLGLAWDDLAAQGLTRTEPVAVWAGSSNSDRAINVDFACHDAASGDPTLSGIAFAPAVLDPGGDPDGDGLDNQSEIGLRSDPLDADSDDDGWIDGDESAPAADSDGDGVRNLLDPDGDGDGLWDGTESGVTAPSAGTDVGAGFFVADADPNTTTSPRDRDSDNGGAADGVEDASGDGEVDVGETDPNDPSDDGGPDTDGDGLLDAQETAIGTDPEAADSDGDGIDDFVETDGGDPVNSDGSSLIDALDPDSDDDGLADADEGVSDGDGDGTGDWRDPDDDDDGIATADELADSAVLGDDDVDDDGWASWHDVDADGDGVGDTFEGQGDGDGDQVPNYLDADDQDGPLGDPDGDGIGTMLEETIGSDPLEADSDGDTIGDLDETDSGQAIDTDLDDAIDAVDADSDGDGLPDADEAGDADLATPPVDSDGDGTPDYRDLDSDGDGTPDALDECPTDPACGRMEEPDAGPAAPDAGGAGFEVGVAGGGCAAGGGAGGGGWLVLALLFLLLPAARRGRAIALALVLAAAPAAADEGAFEVERFRLAIDDDGILDVEAGTVPGHLRFALALWLGHADDPLTVYRQDTGERVGSLVRDRTGGDVIASLALWNRVELALGLPVVLAQEGAMSFAGSGTAFPEIESSGLGNLRITPKLRIAGDHRGALAILLTARLPTSGGAAYFGYDRVTLAPELAASARIGRVGLGANLGFQWRDEIDGVETVQTGSELYGRLGTAVHLGPGERPPIELALTLSAASDTGTGNFGEDDSTPLEIAGGPTFRLGDALALFAAAGAGLNDGRGAPDWRVVAGIRLMGGGIDPPREVEMVLTAGPVREPEPEPEPPPPAPAPEPAQPEPAVSPPRDRDSDGDAIIDRLDNCPDEPGDARYQGCVQPQLVMITSERLELLDRVHFESGKADVLPRSHLLLDNVVRVLASHPTISVVEVRGHTDDRGSEQLNMGLSQKRAESVVAYLVGKGVAGDRLRAVGRGEGEPVYDNDTRAGRAANRRVEFVIAPAPEGVKPGEEVPAP
jgi:outer membrane protein OmpA-like peptidoglycan-associated protein